MNETNKQNNKQTKQQTNKSPPTTKRKYKRVIYHLGLTQFKNEYVLIALMMQGMEKKVDFTHKMQSSCRTYCHRMSCINSLPLQNTPQKPSLKDIKQIARKYLLRTIK